MEYEFSRDTVNGGFHAKFSLEHEAFSNWLVDEVGSDSKRINNLLDSVDKIRSNGCHELSFQGREYLLTMDADDVILKLNVTCEGVGSEEVQSEDSALSVNNDNYCAACGLDDFSVMMKSWKGFLNA